MNRDILDYMANYNHMSESEKKQKLYYLKNTYGEAAIKEEMYAIKNTHDVKEPKEKEEVSDRKNDDNNTVSSVKKS